MNSPHTHRDGCLPLPRNSAASAQPRHKRNIGKKSHNVNNNNNNPVCGASGSSSSHSTQGSAVRDNSMLRPGEEELCSRELQTQHSTAGQKLLEAAKTGDLPTINCLLQQHQMSEELHSIPQSHLNFSLLEACRVGRKFIVQKLIRTGADLNASGYKRCSTALHIAAEQGFIDIVEFLLWKNADVNAVDGQGNTALILAVNRAGSSELLKLLLAHGANLHLQNSQGRTALMKAVEVLDIDAVRILLVAGSDITQKNKQRKTARDIAVELDLADVFDSLQFEAEKWNEHALSKAVLSNNTEALKILLDCMNKEDRAPTVSIKRGCDYSSKKYALQKLMESFCSDAKNNKYVVSVKLDMAKILLSDHVPETNFNDYHFGSVLNDALIDAIESGIYDLVEIICKVKNINLNLISKSHSALMKAAEIDKLDVLKLLLNFGADPETANYSGETALTFAVMHGHFQCAKILHQLYKPSKKELEQIIRKIEEQDQIESLQFLASLYDSHEDKISQSLLKYAALNGNFKAMQLIVHNGVDINGTCNGEGPALLFALGYDESRSYMREYCQVMDTVKFLVENGACVNRISSFNSPLVAAVKNKCHRDVLEYLIEHGADVHEVGDDEGNTPLTADNICSLDEGILDILLEAGADPNKANTFGNTALHLAFSWYSYMGYYCDWRPLPIICIKKLFDAGADLEAIDSNGNTPLLLAASIDDKDMFEHISLLKSLGANMKAVNREGKNALILSLGHKSHVKSLKLLTSDEEQVNLQTPDGHTPLIVAALKYSTEAIDFLLEAGADPHVADNKQETALSILLGNVPLDNSTLDYILPTVKGLIRRGALQSLPQSFELPLHEIIKFDDRQLIQLFVTHGAAPFCVKWADDRCKGLSFLGGIGDLIWANLSPLAVALLCGHLAIARYLLGNWFLTGADIVGCEPLYNLKAIAEAAAPDSQSNSFLEEYMSQPMSLVQLSFVAVSTQLGKRAGREGVVRKTPLPRVLQDRLLFKTENVPMDFTAKKDNNPILRILGENMFAIELPRLKVLGVTDSEMNDDSDDYDFDFYAYDGSDYTESD